MKLIRNFFILLFFFIGALAFAGFFEACCNIVSHNAH